jgi:hypothetical protein
MARDPKIIRAEIARLEAAKSSGVRSVSTAGVSTTFTSFDDMTRRIGELNNELVTAGGGTVSPKPRVTGINLESAW